MRSLNPVRLYNALTRPRTAAAVGEGGPVLAARVCSVPGPTVYADAPLRRLLTAIDRRASDLELALADYVRARRTAGVQPEKVLVEFKRVLARAIGLDAMRSRLTGRLIELYFAA